MEPIISLKQLTHIYSPNTPFEQRALDRIDLDIHPGEYLGIIGRTGSGKSTLIQHLNGLLKPTGGRVLLDGEDIAQFGRRKLARNIAYVAQKNELTQATVFDCGLLGRKPYIKWSVGDEDVSICDRVIERVGLAELRLRPVDELS